MNRLKLLFADLPENRRNILYVIRWKQARWSIAAIRSVYFFATADQEAMRWGMVNIRACHHTMKVIPGAAEVYIRGAQKVKYRLRVLSKLVRLRRVDGVNATIHTHVSDSIRSKVCQ